VKARYAARHHVKWNAPAAEAAEARRPRPGASRLAVALLVAAAGLAATVALVADVVG
jgi:hypothetical protein